MRLSPQPRSRPYGTPAVYLRILREAVTGSHRRHPEDLARLATDFAARTGTAHALCLAQGRLGIFAAVAALIRPGQPVVLSPYTIYDVINMVVSAGGRPVFADVDRITGNLDPAQVEALIDDTTGAVLTTHLQGLSCDIEAIAAICRRRGVPLIEDAAQCLGASVNGKPVGSFGEVGIYSFSRAKNVNTIYGGMAVTSDASIAARMCSILAGYAPEALGRLLRRTLGTIAGEILSMPPLFQTIVFPLFRYDAMRNGRLVDKLVGAESDPVARTSLPEHYKRQMTPLQARLALAQLDQVEPDRLIRLGHARRYHEGLSDLPEVQLPPLVDDGSHSYLSYPIQVDARTELVRHMMRRGRDVRLQYYRNLADLPCFGAYFRDCPVARSVAARVVLLPVYPGYRQSEVEKNIEAIRSFFSSSKPGRA